MRSRNTRTAAATLAAPLLAGVLAAPAGAVTAGSAADTASVTHGAAGPTVRYTFPITGGSLNLAKVSGAIGHSGGLHFYNLGNKRSLTVQGFRVVLGDAPRLTGYVPALHARIPVFDLNLNNATITPTPSGVRVDKVGATLTAGAATGLNGALHTSVFTAGLRVGTATVTAVLGR